MKTFKFKLKDGDTKTMEFDEFRGCSFEFFQE